ncbi:DUF1990 family protein [Planctopirus hydrillae]|uniref:DUF1990 domain-containing protein n=1 Tax=Planctopirus hydrillae TaxID=1841610 RepID=A0A1C3E9A0_9PLAN|nr:DUF1990 domain-containing protein [Planctopirus hydrillae]ODA29848.1 hypothetical protein A6X21_07200 [Planctopirus hydrillae]
MRILYLHKPSAEILARFVEQQGKLDFNYSAVGATASTPPAGYTVDRTRIELGAGEEVFDAAKFALLNWQQFRLGWVDVWSTEARLEVGQVVAIMGQAVGLWWLNACRIVYTIDESGPISSFGFAYGTLPGHVESGEERFLVEWDQESDRVTYEILAFSKPNHILTRLGYPLVRRSQKRFGRDSAASMFRAVNEAPAMPKVFQNTGLMSQTSGLL